MKIVKCNNCKRYLESSIESVPFHECFKLPFNK